MKRKIITIFLIFICLCLTGCELPQNGYDSITIYNKSPGTADNIRIDTKDGYFYNRHEKFIVNENEIGIVIYFRNDEIKDDWEYYSTISK